MTKLWASFMEAKGLTGLALAVLVLATVREWYWLWGLLFIFWSIQGLRSGQAFLIEDISRDDDPVLYWLISAMWAGFGLWYVYADLVWRIGPS
ncbi:MAG: hypothetical protein AAF441_19125 [Pseudomonadota bacterium]